MLAHDPQHGGHAQAAAGEFGGEEGVEHAPTGLGIHAAAAVDHIEHDAARRIRGSGDEVFRRQGRDAEQTGTQQDPARIAPDGVRRVGDEVHHHLAQLIGIPADGRHVLGQVAFELDVGAHRDLEHAPHLLDQPREVERADLRLALAGIDQHLLAQLGGPPDGDVRLKEMLARGTAWQRHASEVDAAQDGGEDVVEVVGDAAGQDAEALQPLRMQHLQLELGFLRLCPLELGHIAQAGDQAGPGLEDGPAQADLGGEGLAARAYAQHLDDPGILAHRSGLACTHPRHQLPETWTIGLGGGPP